ncbi:MAG: hypothetical protein JST30_10200 [Armatimonadetes bacterium]|nr:hypothetical protein [Armatimonadota bacterium]
MALDPFVRDVVVAGGVGLVGAAIAAPLTYQALLKTGSRQTVSEFVPEHSGKQGTPTMGGIIVIVGILTALMAVQPVHLFAVVLVAWYGLIGFLDDYVVPKMMPGKRGLGWMPKLAMQVVPFLVLWALAPGSPPWIIGVTAFVVLFFANGFNFADGMDGLAGGIGVVLALSIAVLSLVPGTGVDRTLTAGMIALACAFVPFLVLNAPPAKVFMGDVGSLPIGALLGLAYLQATLFRVPAAPDWKPVLLTLPLLIVLLVEIVPGPLQVASAKLRKGKRLFPFKTPVHHGFQAAGWPETRVVALFVLTQFVGSMVALGLFVWGMSS